jgi:hypothetical protein
MVEPFHVPSIPLTPQSSRPKPDRRKVRRASAIRRGLVLSLSLFVRDDLSINMKRPDRDQAATVLAEHRGGVAVAVT